MAKRKTLLEEGDVIEFKNGMRVYAMVPDKYIFENRIDAPTRKKTHHSLTVGSHLADKIKKSLDLSGKWVVYKTSYDGGGTGHGPHDVYPDGHHVFCEKVDDSQQKVDFYQSGCFTAMILPKDIKPVGKANRGWVVVEEEETE